MRMARYIAAIAVSIAVVFALIISPSAAGNGDVRRSGSCGGNSEWKLKLSPEDGRLEVEFEVDQNVNGDKWRVIMRHEGDRFFRGVRTTKAPSGSFEVHRVVDDEAGKDSFTARARNLSTDELCRGTASI